MKLQGTPLGIARRAVDLAAHDIEAAMDDWYQNDDDNDHPSGDYELMLEPDHDSLGYKLVMEFSDSTGPDAKLVRLKLEQVLVRHGISTVAIIGVNLDVVGVAGFED